MKPNPTLPAKQSPFNFKKGNTEINGDSNKKALIILCYLRELRWLLWLIAVAVISWLSG
jgi:hypothetical protein